MNVTRFSLPRNAKHCVAGAVILAILFGPLGLLYATVGGGLRVDAESRSTTANIATE